ncbi:ATP-binding protein [uncultured Ruminobacter sp.]|uniref:ATP-binding protein n=1 Tax=uncultured Ruminobacter sp. TaxID=538947 RepID=UPI0025DA73F6|nr:ATP-binding protein [uncultured Ruminobacter sp.]
MLDINDYELANPNAASLIQSLRAFGYDISTAVADLIDNSITANASDISISFDWNSGAPFISIADDGYGMTETELFEAMKTGSKNPLDTRDERDLGRFGLGLKTASFSQCKRLTVASKTNDSSINVRCWDLDIVNETNEWILLKKVTNTANRIIDDVFSDRKHGTVVIWEKLDKIVPDECVDDEDYQKAFLNYAKQVKNHISLVFSSYMKGSKRVLFKLNNRAVDLWDPFMSDCTFTSLQPSETLYINGHEVTIKPYILPHQSKISTEDFALYGGLHGWNEQQGFYIYRNNRLIVAGAWLLPDMEKKEQYRLARIRIDIGNETDSEWGIDVRKSIAIPPIPIQKELRRIAVVAQKESAKVYRHRGKKLARNSSKIQAYVWQQNLRSGKICYSINREHPIIKQLLSSSNKKEVAKLIDLIEETVPVPMIISDYSEKSDEMLNPFEGRTTNQFDDMIDALYEMYRSNGYSPQEAVKNIASTEPYIYAPEKVQLFCEREGIDVYE